MNSPAIEDYLMQVYRLKEKRKELRSINLAEGLGVSKPSVSEMIRKMKEEGLVDHVRYGKLDLTPKGQRRATKLIAKHRLIELFLKKVLKSKSNLHSEAHKLEHAFSDESIKQIRKILGDPKYDPHGKPIPWRIR